MPSLILAREVYCPVERTFAYHTDLTNAPQYWPNLAECRRAIDQEGPPAVGARYAWRYNMLGRTFKGEMLVTDLAAGERFAFETTGGVRARFRNEYRATAKTRTRITVFVEYQVPGILGRAVDRLFIERRNAADAEHAMDQLQTILESEVLAALDAGVV